MGSSLDRGAADQHFGILENAKSPSVERDLIGGGAKLEPPWWIQRGVTPEGPDIDMGSWKSISFSKSQQEKYGIAANGTVVDKVKFNCCAPLSASDKCAAEAPDDARVCTLLVTFEEDVTVSEIKAVAGKRDEAKATHVMSALKILEVQYGVHRLAACVAACRALQREVGVKAIEFDR